MRSWVIYEIVNAHGSVVALDTDPKSAAEFAASINGKASARKIDEVIEAALSPGDVDIDLDKLADEARGKK